MKRMVLIPEEKLLRYEQREKEDSKLPEGVMYGGGTEEAVHGIPKNMKEGARVMKIQKKHKKIP